MKIAILDAKTFGRDIDLSSFSKFGDVKIYQTTSSEKRLKRIKDRDIIITNKVIIDKYLIDNAPTLTLICVAATGTNNIDLDYAREKGIAVTNVAGYSTQSVVQHTFAMLFYLLEHANYYDKYSKSGQYARNNIFTHIGRPFWEIYGKRWGIIGLGAIGKEVGKIAKSFGCDVVYYSTTGKHINKDFKKVELDELLNTSDIVSIHAPLNERTKNLVTYNKFKILKPSAILLNLGRGGIVNEGDLAKALKENLIAGAGLDVLEKEPIELDNPLLSIKDKGKLFITPHIAWASIEARERLIDEVILNIEYFLQGKKRNRVV